MSERKEDIIKEAKLVIQKVDLLEGIFRKAQGHLNSLIIKSAELHRKIVDFEQPAKESK